jgi:uncharacterized membrane protein YeaQ/YmgE (transglycosylase-associated protein family)
MITLLIVLVGWGLIGIVAGTIATPHHPGGDSMGRMGTMLVGITGSLVGGVGTYLLGYGVAPTQMAGWIMSTVGAIVFVCVPAFMGRDRRSIPTRAIRRP